MVGSQWSQQRLRFEETLEGILKKLAAKAIVVVGDVADEADSKETVDQDDQRDFGRLDFADDQ